MQQIDDLIASANVDTKKPNWRLSVPKPAVATFTPGQQILARMKTNKGTVVLRLLPDVAPMHVTSFAYLARLGFYDGLPFHRVISAFMAQGGCPLGTGTGTDGSQFFLTFVATPWLDGKHTIFGEVIEGMDVLKKLEAAGSQSGKTSEPLQIETLTIEG